MKNHAQILATDPEKNVWVNASAGTGKTKILIDRVLRILLKYNNFNKILCITFTNNAVNEIRNRINRKLHAWCNIEEEKLRLKILNDLGYDPSNLEIDNAKNLYNQYLNPNNSLKICTIHSFCQQILRQFPIEASIAPNFGIIDQKEVKQIILDLRKELLKSSHLKIINKYLIENFHEVTISEIFDEIIQNRTKILQCDIPNYSNQEISEMLYELNLCTETEKEMSILLQDSTLLHYVQDINIKNILSFFLTSKGEKKKNIVNQVEYKKNPGLKKHLQSLQDIVYDIEQKRKTKHIIIYSKIIIYFANNVIKLYQQYKNVRGLLDYDDLVIKTKEALKQVETKDWILNKLDMSIDHILLDEAQDTSIEQWDIISYLVENIYSENTGNNHKTIFIVGDEKQSIFSFQGANVEFYNKMKDLFTKKFSSTKTTLLQIDLKISYRSSQEIIDLVNRVFSFVQKYYNCFNTNFDNNIASVRKDCKAVIECWELHKNEKSPELFWPIIGITKNAILEDNKKKLANDIAKFILNKLESKIIVQSTGTTITAKDFMILFRKRDEFVLELLNSIRSYGIEVEILDRMLLINNLAIQDLLSIAKFVINPFNDLNLVGLMKSPIFSLNDAEIQTLLQNNTQNQKIWQYIQNSMKNIEKTNFNNHYKNILHSLYNILNRFNTIHNNVITDNLFYYILDILQYRINFVLSFGEGINDILNELIYLNYEYNKKFNTSLNGFITWLENEDIEIKQPKTISDKVRIMTVHAAKGLEAPFVILCDTTTIAKLSSKLLFVEDENSLIACQNVINIPFSYQELKKEINIKMIREYNRLLYVALTRASDYLVICGLSNNNLPPHEYSWYSLIRNAIGDLKNHQKDTATVHYDNLSNEKIHNSPDDILVNLYSNTTVENRNTADIKTKIANISYAPNPMNHSVKFGMIFHKIIEDAVRNNSLKHSTQHPLTNSLDENWLTKLKIAINNIIDKGELQKFINKNPHCELNVGSVENDKIKLGRIDLAVFDGNIITIIDYKSDNVSLYRNKPIPMKYIEQISFYYNVISSLYPQYEVMCKILWLETGIFQNIDLSNIKNNLLIN
ncbi:UvrD-helicase domain-containing protein [Rickettsia endosymbiont of Cardiosporidium cionae]|uniref:UvrD-helicase domain-containing protein n=1 Tax=Rickettsia endosymbiont of Cardiosporidium cionae TaxID=2777155 RepID=UPI001893344E|nr:UvrD-helicase domain-containing protein [Rickettsia endosymbiont of Cardiosporidium cionae]KAF8818291.1 ATP-dependent helicase/nuclease subunit A [Rickettsia endosymbiont of Cardiosporidium cionae]